MKKVDFWKSAKAPRGLRPIRSDQLRLPKANMGFSKDAKELVKLGVGVAVAGAALGLGLKAFHESLDGGN